MYLALAPALVMGWGPFPRLGVAGTATANLGAFGLATLVLAVYLCSPRSPIRLSLRGLRFRRALFWEILRVGAPGSLNTILTNLTVVLMTGLVGPFGTAALAGYGMGARLEYIQIPLVFGMGSALVAMVGTNVGAGQIARAERIAWTGAGLAAGVTAVDRCSSPPPSRGPGWGSSRPTPRSHAAGATYLLIVGPTYGFFGLGLALYFASQGAGRLPGRSRPGSRAWRSRRRAAGSAATGSVGLARHLRGDGDRAHRVRNDHRCRRPARGVALVQEERWPGCSI